MKKILAIILGFAFLQQAQAVAPGFYLGLMAGPATNSGGTQTVTDTDGTTTTATPKSGQFAARLFLGYLFAQYIGAELGGTYYSDVNYSTAEPTSSDYKTRISTMDVVLKGLLPFGGVGAAYVKAGGAAVFQSSSSGLSSSDSGSKTSFKPTISLGASYDLTQSWVADISWNRLMNVSLLGNVDFFALGISYHFVDRYCGQFLCDE